MKLLAIDTATEACSAAILDGDRLFSRFKIAPREHNRLLFLMCNELLAESQLIVDELDAIAFGRGPGSFTGVRIAAMFSQAIAFSHNLPVIAVSDLQILAQEISDRYTCSEVLGLINARLNEIYYGVYCRDEYGLVQLVGQENITTYEGILHFSHFTGSIGGSGLSACSELKKLTKAKVCANDIWPSARTMLQIAVAQFARGETCTPGEALPVYMNEYGAVCKNARTD